MIPTLTKPTCTKCGQQSDSLAGYGSDDLCNSCYETEAADQYWSERVADQERMILDTEQRVCIEDLDF